MNKIEQLERLQKLLAEGAITKEEFETLKHQAIEEEAASAKAATMPDAGHREPGVLKPIVTAPNPEPPDPNHKVYGQTDFIPPARKNVVQTKTTTTTAPTTLTGNNTAKTLGVLALLALVGVLGWYYFLKPTDKIPPAAAATGDTTGAPYNITSQAGNDMEDPFELNELQVEEANSTAFKTYHGENVTDPIAYPTDIVKPREPVVVDASTKPTETATKKKGTTTADTAAASQPANTTTTPKRSQAFASPEGDVSMFIHEEESKNSLAGKYREELNTIGGNKSVTYKLLKDDFFVVSGYKGDNVYYQKTVVKDGKFKTFYTEYPKSKKDKMDPVTVRMSRSFK